MSDDSKKSPESEAADFLKEGMQSAGGFLGGLSSLIEKVGDLADKGKELRESGDFKHGDKEGKYGVSVKFGLGDGPGGGGGGGFGDASPSVGPVNESARNERREAAARVREPEVDVFPEDDEVLLVAELPGITAGGVALTPTDNGLQLVAVNQQFRFEKVIETPFPIDTGAAEVSSNNGVFEIRLPRA